MSDKLTQKELDGMLTAASKFPHVHNDWNIVVTDHPIKRVVYLSNTPWRQKFKTAYAIFTGSVFMKRQPLRRLQSALSYLFNENAEMPDATVWHGNIVTFWMEHAEYIAAMSPTSVERALTELAEYRLKEAALQELLPSLSKKAQKDIQKILDSNPNVNKDDFSSWDKLVSIMPHEEAERLRKNGSD
ncbi:hypothetical protein E6Q11_06540 [Candidatus Dojkabacteria bacterium]|uniref:Uncharacterized protein n=1 Tax=Candidatus Dojkabacteria bacterium TaxID=2099670 RepID=A0A5C7J3G7_9BACT|nr:MAG: hypothetical protein E6Q11_06540 [Candidatus Dojkabacteria bacterium]